MARYAALLRGVNVGRAKRVAMADWRVLLEAQGCSDVKTLLNSGNAVFSAPAQPAARLARRIQQDIEEQLGVSSHVVVKTAAEIGAIVEGNALHAIAADPARLLVAFTGDAARLRALAPLAAQDWAGDVLHVGEHAAYLWCAGGILASQLAVTLLRDLEGAGTTRNWATVSKLEAML